MSKIMLVNVNHVEESRVGIVSDGSLSAFEVESGAREHLKGNIYKGVVHRIHPALEAAFVDIGTDRDAFLPMDEVCFRNLPKRSVDNSEEPESAEEKPEKPKEARRRRKLSDLLSPGDQVVVQISKEQFGTKPPTLSTYYSLPGRHLVLLPGSEDSGISRRIEGSDRAKIREALDQVKPSEGFGLIVRTVTGGDKAAEDLQRDLSYLEQLWGKIQDAADSRGAPSLIYREHDVVLRTIRDSLTSDIDQIHIDSVEVFDRAREFLADLIPGTEKVLQLYDGKQPIFSHFKVESQIESIYRRRVSLRSGGSIVIDSTEALTAIDVNSGRSIRGSSQEDTAFRTNQEAAVEIARQLRLRDLGGLVVIDFIDMRSSQHTSQVEKTFRSAMHIDRARHEIGRISQFGLLEISRQRIRPAATASSYVSCRNCDGRGLIRTPESAAVAAFRRIHSRVAQGDVATLRIALCNDVAIYLLNQKRDELGALERRWDVRIEIAPREDFLPHHVEFEAKPRAGNAVSSGLRVGGVTPEGADANGKPRDPEKSAGSGESSQSKSNGEGEERSGRRSRRRRGRRGGRGRGRPGAPGAEGALAEEANGAETSREKPSLGASDKAHKGDVEKPHVVDETVSPETSSRQGAVGSKARASNAPTGGRDSAHDRRTEPLEKRASESDEAATVKVDTAPSANDAEAKPKRPRSRRGGGRSRGGQRTGTRDSSRPTSAAKDSEAAIRPENSAAPATNAAESSGASDEKSSTPGGAAVATPSKAVKKTSTSRKVSAQGAEVEDTASETVNKRRSTKKAATKKITATAKSATKKTTAKRSTKKKSSASSEEGGPATSKVTKKARSPRKKTTKKVAPKTVES